MHVEYLLAHVICVLVHVHVLCGCKCTKCDNVHSCMDTCMCSSVHSCGCVADGGFLSNITTYGNPYIHCVIAVCMFFGLFCVVIAGCWQW